MKIKLLPIAFILFNLIHISYTDETDSGKDIVGGTEVEVGRYPYQVAIMKSSRPICGGSLIAKDWVLTAGHCRGPDRVIIGRHNIANASEVGFENIEVDYQIVHPRHRLFINWNDLSLLKLKTPSNFSHVKLNDGSQDTSDGRPVTTIGWGRTQFGGERSDVLLEVEVDIVNNLRCSVDYLSIIPPNMMCAAREGKDACQGDSGGPLITKGENASSDVQVGIVSWGLGCAEPGFPGVYTCVIRFHSWINAQMNKDSRRLHVLKRRLFHKIKN